MIESDVLFEIVKMLLEKEDSNTVDNKEKNEKTPASLCCEEWIEFSKQIRETPPG